MSTASSSKLKASSQGAATTVEPAEQRAGKGEGAYPEKGASRRVPRSSVKDRNSQPAALIGP
eukprot:3975507-Alexandrium_andersonii.AAC.1